jgi:hypothetical protein
MMMLARANRRWTLPLAAALLGAACSSSGGMSSAAAPAPATAPATAPARDPRIGLRPGLFDAGEAVWNLRVLSRTPPPREFLGRVNSDLAFTGNYAIQGSFNGFQVWDITTPAQPALVTAYVCPASQSDVSVYRNLLFVSGENLAARLDCGTQGVDSAVSPDRLRGLRIFDISDIKNPKNVGNVQTCRGSHTHSVLVDPRDTANVYVYISGSSGVRPAEELAGCSRALPEEDPGTALFRIEVIKVPLAHPESAAIVSSPRIFADLVAPPRRHAMAPEDSAQLANARARGAFVVDVGEDQFVLPDGFARMLLDSIVRSRGDSGPATGADSAALRQGLVAMVAQMMEGQAELRRRGPTQCHDITLYPAIGLAGGACEGYGLLLDISDPVNPRRIGAVSDSNFSYWHSATFNNDGTKILFSDEWGGGGGPKCRASDPMEWGADAIFTLADRQMRFASYFKMPAPQTSLENCVAHNGSMIPIPGRDVMVQAWYQGGISVFDWTDAAHPLEIAFHDRGPLDPNEMQMAGSWSVYWYNGVIVSSEIVRGLDVFELVPSAYVTQNEIDAAQTVRYTYYNTQGQQRFVWPPSFALARAYADQLERSRGLAAGRLAAVRTALADAERASGAGRRDALARLAGSLDSDTAGSSDAGKVRMLAEAVRSLAAAN